MIIYLGSTLFKFNTPPSNIVYLVSRNVQFLNDEASKLRKGKGVFITDKHRRFRNIPKSSLKLCRLKHCNVGGPSNFEVLWAYNKLKLKNFPSILKRRIGNYIDYSVIPSTKPESTQYLNHKKLLPIEHTNAWISFSTQFLGTGIGYRQLIVSELSKICGVSYNT